MEQGRLTRKFIMFSINSKQKLNFRDSNGFIALVSVIILGFVLFATVITLGSRSLGTRFLLLDLERKDITDGLAGGCLQVAIINIVGDPAYEGNDFEVNVGDKTCKIISVTNHGAESMIRTKGELNGVTTNYEAVWNKTQEKIISLVEIS